MNAFIRAEGVSKKFRRGELHDSLRDLIPALTRKIFGRSPSRSDLDQGDFWAVEDVTFDVLPGEALGIIGPNGAGKSTMLKLLTKILRPNRGFIEVKGRIGALIEIAAGFHPDLTGRENIFLQGAIMGMRRHEILERFDQIVDFSGIPDFIDTPVKRYSSGMNARLGFSIAAHLEPDVLIIDEVLAVGDFAFQAKAFDRIKELATKSGIPVVVVSHQLDRVATLCSKAILLNKGQVARQGATQDCISAYVLSEFEVDTPASEDATMWIEHASLVSEGVVASGSPAKINVQGQIRDPRAATDCAVAVRVRALHTGEILYVSDSRDCDVELPGEGEFSLDIVLDMNVSPGLYALETVVRDFGSRRRVQVGPSIPVQVRVGQNFQGSVQMNARMERAETAVRR